MQKGKGKGNKNKEAMEMQQKLENNADERNHLYQNGIQRPT